MADEELGPNGAVLYALEELEADDGWQWLEAGLRGLGEDYVLFDCPGQVELFTHHGSLKKIFMRIQKMGYRESNLLMVSNLVLDSSSCSISQTLTPLPSLRSTFRPSCYP